MLGDAKLVPEDLGLARECTPTQRWALELPMTQRVSVAGHVIHVLHARSQFAIDPVTAGIAVIILTTLTKR
jgi:hypothetical protein